MTATDTELALAAMTDEGAFEKLATAVLRSSEPLAAALIHTGMNAEGKTQASPVDGMHFVGGASPSHIVIAQHTITAGQRLERKWLYDPAGGAARASHRRPAEVGDVIKAAEQVRVARGNDPATQATLFLTTNQEPSPELIQKVAAAGTKFGLDIVIWSRAHIAHVLDTDPMGQWLRQLHLGIASQRLSTDLLQNLSKLSLEANRPLGDAASWIDRASDRRLASAERPLTLLVSASGQGKSVACYRTLASHVVSGGFGIVLNDATLAAAPTLDQAVWQTLRALHPALHAQDSPFSFCCRCGLC